MVRIVAFVNIRQLDGQLLPKGTAFFTGHLDRKTATFRFYVVTAKHVLDMIRERTAADAVVLTFNGKDGKEERELPLSAWHSHPGRDGEVVDVTIARLSSLLRRGPLRSPNLAHLDSGTSPHSTSFCLSTKGGGNFGRIVPVLPLAATTSGISPRSGPDDSLLAFSLIRSSSALHPGS